MNVLYKTHKLLTKSKWYSQIKNINFKFHVKLQGVWNGYILIFGYYVERQWYTVNKNSSRFNHAKSLFIRLINSYHKLSSLNELNGCRNIFKKMMNSEKFIATFLLHKINREIILHFITHSNMKSRYVSVVYKKTEVDSW